MTAGRPTLPFNSLALPAMGGAALMVAHLVAGKTARDALFLSRFDPTQLPKMFAGAAVFSILAGLWFTRLLTRRGPARTLPVALAASVALHLGEYGAMAQSHGPIVVLVYLHIAGLGAILLSTFWSVVNEAFDPREAKQRFPRIAGAGTVGGIAGGALAAWIPLESLLLLLAAFHALAAVVIWRLGKRGEAGAPGSRGEPIELRLASRRALRQAPFLWNLGVLVLLGTVAAALLDYVFKSGAVRVIGKGAELARFFALFYTANQVVTFVAQTWVTPPTLKSLGLGRTLVALPAAVAAGAGGALLFPSLLASALVRSVELIVKGSLFRSAYELFFTPIPPREKRSVKTAIDVGCDRLGDVLGAAVIQLALLFGTGHVYVALLAATIVIAAAGMRIAAPMDRAYLRVLEHGLVNRAVELDVSEVEDSTTLSALMRSTAGQSVPSAAAPLAVGLSAPERRPRPVPASDPALERLGDLRSGDSARVRAALGDDSGFDPLAVPQAIRLLAWNEVSDAARDYLLRCSERVTGQLIDGLLNASSDFAVRRRIPRILAHSGSQRAVDGLVPALGDVHFEIRFQASRALEYMHRTHSGLNFDHQALLRTVERELSVSQPIWRGRKLLDQRDDADASYSYLDEVVRDRADQSLEHVFSLLAILLPREPLKVAFRALHSDDRILRGLALEYLETALPPASFAHFLQLLEPADVPKSGRDPRSVVEALMASHESIVVRLKTASADARPPDGKPPGATPA